MLTKAQFMDNFQFYFGVKDAVMHRVDDDLPKDQHNCDLSSGTDIYIDEQQISIIILCFRQPKIN